VTTCTKGNAWPFTGSTYVPVSDRVEDAARRLRLADVAAEGCPEDRDDHGGGLLVQEGQGRLLEGSANAGELTLYGAQFVPPMGCPSGSAA
jgi:hypothetical protein